MLKKIKDGAGRPLLWFFAYFAAFAYWELLMYRLVYGSLRSFGIWPLLFILPFAMFFTALSGCCGRFRFSWLADMLPLLAVAVFYSGQLLYFRTFGSMASVSMIGVGGDALKNFGWGLAVTVKQSIWLLLLFMLPVLLFAVGFALIRDRRYAPVLHGAAALLAVLLWIIAAALLPLGGTQSHSAYAAYHSSLVDTDSASAKLGVLANSSIEAAGMIFGRRDAQGDGLSIASSDQLLPDSDFLELTVLNLPKEAGPSSSGQGGDENPNADDEEDVEEIVDTSPNIIEGLDFAALAENSGKKDIKELCAYFELRSGTARNRYTGIFEGHSLIYICAESFCGLAIDETVTPTLWKLSHEGVVLDNFYNSFKNTTTNGEFALLTGLWPDVSREGLRGSGMGTFAQSSGNYMPFALGTLFNEQCGTLSKGYHNYLGEYYRRDRCLPALGFECKFMNDGMWFTSSWPSSDLEMMEQSVGDYINDERFCAYYMTFSGHGPYSAENVMYRRNIEEVQRLLDGRRLNPEAVGYLACNYELERAMSYLLRRLEEAGRLEDTVIVLAGDHYPYYLQEAGRNSLAGHEVDTNFEMYKSRCIMWNGGLKEPIISDVPCCNVDILPTIFNLFGLEYDSRLLAGNDVFSDSIHVATLYNKSFVTDTVRYNSATGEAEWLGGSLNPDEDLRQTYLNAMIDYVKNVYSMSLKIEESDFYRPLFELLKEADTE